MTRIVKQPNSWVALLFATLLLAGCAGETQKPMEETEAEAESVAALPSTFLYIGHPVADFDPWLAAYEAHAGARTDHGLSEIWIYRDLDQAGMVHILFAASDVEQARQFAGMEDLRTVMNNAGVMGEPTLGIMKLVEETRPEQMPQSQYHLLVSHEVADWPKWKEVYDEHKPARDAAGLASRGIARSVDNPNMLYLNFAVGDLDAARAFVGSEDLKQAMANAGVVGVPNIFFTETYRTM